MNHRVCVIGCGCVLTGCVCVCCEDVCVYMC